MATTSTVKTSTKATATTGTTTTSGGIGGTTSTTLTTGSTIGMSRVELVRKLPPIDVLTPVCKSSRENYRLRIERTDRQAFRGVEFLLSCMGYAVGLGNIWRFPTIVYENGGSVFLIPYAICLLVFAMPAIHMEFALGQHHAKSPPVIFRRIMPVLEGIGWMSPILGGIIGVYYMVLISWISIYLANTGNAVKIGQCGNHWNNPTTCFVGVDQKKCSVPNPPGFTRTVIHSNGTSFLAPMPKMLIYINQECRDAEELEGVQVATEQFFRNFVVRQSRGFTDFHQLHFPSFAGLALCWFFTSLVLIRGMKTISKMSYVTAILPYVIICILLGWGASLEGAADGMTYFLFHFDFSALYKLKTWTAALTQVCFSLSIGIGGLMNIASYNKRSHNWYRDAWLVVVADTLMSLLGGATVFCTLGFLAKTRGVNVPEVIQNGPALAFIVYTEAIAHMPVPWIWWALFFIMLLLLGVSTEILIVEILCTCITDRFLTLRKHRWIVVIGVSMSMFVCGIVMTTDAGFYWVDLFDEYAAGVSSLLCSALTFVSVCYLYGVSHFRADIKEMLGEPRTFCSKYFGASSRVWTYSWQVSSPFFCLLIIVFFVYTREYPFKGDNQMYPPIFDIIGWLLTSIPFFIIPLFAVLAVVRFKKRKLPWKGALILQRRHPSFHRVFDGWKEEKRLIADQLSEREPGEPEMDVLDGKNAPQEDSIIE